MPESSAHSQEIFHVISNVLLFLGVSGLLIPVLQRFRLSPVLAYLLCGMLIGPYGLALLVSQYPWLSAISMSDSKTVSLLGEFGIITLMFMIGLELSFRRLKELKSYVFGLGSAQIIVTALLIFAISRVVNHSIPASMLIGASFALSSTAVVMQLLEEQRLSNRGVGILCFSVLLMQDLAVVPILVLAYSFAPDNDYSIVFLLARSILLAVLTVVLIYLLGRWLLRPVLNIISDARNPEWLSSFMMLIVITCASLTLMAGLSAALGAFLAGLLIAETEFRYEMEVIISPIKSLLLGIFFMSVGMQINLAEIAKHPGLILSSVLGLYTLKSIALFVVAKLFKIESKQAAQASIYLAQSGEFAFMIISLASLAQIISADDAQYFMMITALSMMLTPLLFKIAPYLTNRLAQNHPVFEVDNFDFHERMVIIAGFGRIGKLLGEILEQQRVPYIAIDRHAEKVQRLRKQGFRVFYGDARKIDLWKLVHAQSAVAAVITVDDQHAANAIIKAIQGKWPLLPIIVRAKDIADISSMHDLGAKYVVPETLESSLRIARILMQELGIDQESIDGAIEQSWTQSSTFGVN